MPLQDRIQLAKLRIDIPWEEAFERKRGVERGARMPLDSTSLSRRATRVRRSTRITPK
jgi:hypothetical protein